MCCCPLTDPQLGGGVPFLRPTPTLFPVMLTNLSPSPPGKRQRRKPKEGICSVCPVKKLKDRWIR